MKTNISVIITHVYKICPCNHDKGSKFYEVLESLLYVVGNIEHPVRLARMSMLIWIYTDRKFNKVVFPRAPLKKMKYHIFYYHNIVL